MSTSHSTETLQLRQLFESSADKYPNNIALICENMRLSYQELEWRTNQFANYLLNQGINEKHSIGIFLERSLDSYISILAVLKTGAAYVPIEVDYPDERVNHILADMPFHSVITSLSQSARHTHIQFPNVIVVDQIKADISQQSNTRPALTKTESDQLCYVIYTSGSTGKPKGVEITHRNICHYVSVASDLYKMTPHDKVYQGFSLAFDASLEELWMTFANGGTLIACTSKDIRSGVGLTDFLNDHKVTVFSTVPTLLSTLEDDFPELRLLILGGEACSDQLINRWSRTGLRIINTYGPTEATVIATYAECHAHQPVTIGKPLPGYDVLILDEHLQPVPNGQQGELCIAGLGLARGYVNQPEITAQKFIKHPSDENQRLYRTGDLAMLNTNGDIQFLGRIDDQIKLRGFRIELNEIEAIIMEYGAITQAVVVLQDLGSPTLVAYIRPDKNTNLELKQFKNFLEDRLPHYMVPSLFEILESFPLLPSGKVNRKALPIPKQIAESLCYVQPQTTLEKFIANVFLNVLQINSVSITADFFYDLGGHSLLAARIISQLRKNIALQYLSMRDLYENPTIEQLAKKVEISQVQYASPSTSKTPKDSSEKSPWGYYACAMAQALGCILQFALVSWETLLIVFILNFSTTHYAFYSLQTIGILIGLTFSLPPLLCLISVLAKWVIIGQIKPGHYPLWGTYYFRWWLAKAITHSFGLQYLVGTQMLNVYCRLMGAKIGYNCIINTRYIASFDLLSIGNNTSINHDALLHGYIIEDGLLKIGTTTIGDNCCIGARTVLDINTVMENNSTLHDLSVLPKGGVIPKGQTYHGSPALHNINADDKLVAMQYIDEKKYGIGENIIFAGLQYLGLCLVSGIYIIAFIPACNILKHFYTKNELLMAIFVGAPLGAAFFLISFCFLVILFKKILTGNIQPGTYKVRSLFYIRKSIVERLISSSELAVLAETLFLPFFLRALGAKIGKRVEVADLPHVTPELLSIKSESFTTGSVFSGVSQIKNGNVTYLPVEIGHRTFVGNTAVMPPGTKLGNHCLLGCLTIAPVSDKAQQDNTAWLGSPPFFLPRRETQFHITEDKTFYPPKYLYVIRTLFELVRIIVPMTFILTMILGFYVSFDYLTHNYSITELFLLFPFFDIAVLYGLTCVAIGLKWLLMGRFKETVQPLWSLYIWKSDLIERLHNAFIGHWVLEPLMGTPFAAFFLRLLGVKIGKRSYIETSNGYLEYDLVTIGDDVALNHDCVLQSHLFEDRVFKAGPIKIENNCTIGAASEVLYNTVMKQNSTLGSLSLLMKGEQLPMNSRWQGVPAQAVYDQNNWQVKSEALDVASNSFIIETE